MSREWENKQTDKKPILSAQVGGWYRPLEQQHLCGKTVTLPWQGEGK